jgi:hypothetical protein
MNKVAIFFTSVIFGFLFLVGPVSAGHMRCGVHTVSDGQRKGMGKYEVLKKCGQPTEQIGNTWVYDTPGRSKKVLRFNDAGRLTSIDG